MDAELSNIPDYRMVPILSC